MNYRHIYHAGNFADVMKHVTLCLILDHLKAKDKPFFLLDTHAGIGRYDLHSEEAQRTGEFRNGIARLLAEPELPPAFAGYVATIAAINGGRRVSPTGLRWYPGSPRILRAALRSGDRLTVVELHPADADSLQREFAGDQQVVVHRMDGYQALKALLPPQERRGLVVVDPPFEERDEFTRLVQGLRQAHRRWSTGIYVLWYPIKARRPIDAFHDDVTQTGICRIVGAELMIRAADDSERLNGCGMLIVNPPWRLIEQLQPVLSFLARLMGENGDGRWRAEWLVPE